MLFHGVYQNTRDSPPLIRRIDRQHREMSPSIMDVYQYRSCETRSIWSVDYDYAKSRIGHSRGNIGRIRSIAVDKEILDAVRRVDDPHQLGNVGFCCVARHHWKLYLTVMTFDLDTSINVLRRTPATIDALLRNLPDALARGNEGQDTFNPFDVVGHLIDGEETDWMTRARIILSSSENKTFEPYDRFRHYARNKGRTMISLLDEFAQLREKNLAELEGWKLKESQLDLTGVHPTFGNVTLQQLLASWVVHDLGHIAQISRVMAKQYRNDVGPWTPFLPVLTDRE